MSGRTATSSHPLSRVVGLPDDRERPLRLLALAALLVSLPSLVLGVLFVVDDLRTTAEEWDGFGVFLGLALLAWTAVPLVLLGLAWRLRRRYVACAVLAGVAGVLLLWTGASGMGWFPVGGVLGVVLAVVQPLLALATTGLAVLVVVRSVRARRTLPVG